MRKDFVRGLEKGRLLTAFLGQNVENLDGYGCPKIQNLVGEGKTNSLWICSGYPFRHQTRLHWAEIKQRGMENGLCNIFKFRIVSCIVVKYPINCLKFFNLFQTFGLRN